MPTIQPKTIPNPGPKEAAPNCSPMNRSMSSFRCAITEVISSWCIGPMLFCNTAGRESMAQPSKAVPQTTSIATGVIALSDSLRTLGFSGVEPRSSFITPVRFAIASTPERARITPTN